MASATALLVATTAIAAAASVAGGVAANRNAKAEAKFRRQVGASEAEDKRREGIRLLAAQNVAFAKAGVATNVGTPLDALGDAAASIELNALRARFGRAGEASALRAQGRQAQTQGFISAAGTVLGAVGTQARTQGFGTPRPAPVAPAAPAGGE